MSTTSPRTTKVTRVTLERLRQRGEKAVFLTAYDYPTAVLAERAGVDMLLVGDSAAMTMLSPAATPALAARASPRSPPASTTAVTDMAKSTPEVV